MSSGPGNFCLVHVSLVPVLNVVGEHTGAQIIYAKYSGTEVEECKRKTSSSFAIVPAHQNFSASHPPVADKAAKGLRMYSLQRKGNRSLEKIILEAVMITCWLKVLEVKTFSDISPHDRSGLDIALIFLFSDLPDYVRFSPRVLK
ncbi:unnamed protein product [Brassica oleracea]